MKFDKNEEYDNAYTNFGAHIDVHRWSCVGKLDDVQQHIINPEKAETKDENGWSCLHWACYAGRTDVIRLLHSSAGIALDAKTKTGDTALHIVSRQNNVEVFQVLLDMGADPHTTNDRGKLPHQQSRGENAALLRALSEGVPRRQKIQLAAPQRKAGSDGLRPGIELVGQCIAVEYQDESDDSDASDNLSSWYRARVESFDSKRHRHRVVWEDGTKDWIANLKVDEFKIVSAESFGVKQRRRQRPAAGPAQPAQQDSTPFAAQTTSPAATDNESFHSLTALKTSSGEGDCGQPPALSDLTLPADRGRVDRRGRFQPGRDGSRRH